MKQVQSISACSPMSGLVKSLRLSFFGHLACTTPKEDHHCVIVTAHRPPADWRRPVGHSRTTWLSTIDDLQSLNFGVGVAQLGGRQKIRTFGIKSSVQKCSTD